MPPMISDEERGSRQRKSKRIRPPSTQGNKASKQKPPKYLFRGDINYQYGTPIGLPRDEEADNLSRAQDAVAHVLDEKGGRYVSFATILSSAKKFARKGMFVRINKISKVAWEALQTLEGKGVIRIFWPEDVAQLVKTHYPKKKARRLANSIKRRMEENNEVLIEGQIPAQYIEKTN